jgi:iron complex transport system permease protein
MKGLSLIVVCLLVLAVVALFSMSTGRYPVSFADLLTWITTGQCSDENLPIILVNIRLPRLVGAIAAGGALAMSGSKKIGIPLFMVDMDMGKYEQCSPRRNRYP